MHASSDRLIRRLSNRYLLLLGCVALLVALDQVVIQPLLVRVNGFAPAINVAGRQRMLSQRLTKAALAMQLAGDANSRAASNAELRQALDEWSAAHRELRQGSGLLQPTHTSAFGISQAVADIEPHYRAMAAAAKRLASGDRAPEAVQTLLQSEPLYLPAMDRVVKLLEMQSARQISWLRMLAVSIASGVLLLLAGIGWFVVRPATRLIRTHMDELEHRVAQRTGDLTRANNALRSEILAREAAETSSRRLAAQLAHAARVSTMGHLSAGLAHELNQPLAAITNYAETCELVIERQPPSGSRLAEHVQQIKHAALRAGRIVGRMRNFLRPGGGCREEVRLAPLVCEVADFCCFEAERAGVRIVLDLAADGTLSADPIQIQQVLVNLIQNAIQAMQACPPQQRRLLIRTRRAEGADALQVEVSDQGPGFGTRDPESLFQPFYTTKPSGLGVGLSICRSIVEDHGGTIWAHWAEGRGAIVGFALPQLQADGLNQPCSADGICR
jgi:C4-dicarboxylate-specific signal transduction histidine kinase